MQGAVVAQSSTALVVQRGKRAAAASALNVAGTMIAPVTLSTPFPFTANITRNFFHTAQLSSPGQPESRPSREVRNIFLPPRPHYHFCRDCPCWRVQHKMNQLPDGNIPDYGS